MTNPQTKIHVRNSSSPLISYLLLILLGALASACGSGPVDGTWKVTSATCAGAAATGALAASYTAPAAQSYTINNLTGTQSVTVSSTCSYTVPLVLTYPNSTTFTIQANGIISCSTASSCSGSVNNCSQSYTGAVTTWTYSKTSNSLQFTGDATNTACSTNGQGNPVSYTATKQ